MRFLIFQLTLDHSERMEVCRSSRVDSEDLLSVPDHSGQVARQHHLQVKQHSRMSISAFSVVKLTSCPTLCGTIQSASHILTGSGYKSEDLSEEICGPLKRNMLIYVFILMND